MLFGSRKVSIAFSSVSRILDVRVGDPELIEVARLPVEVVTSRNEKLQMVQPGMELGEKFAGVRRMAHQAEHQAALRPSEADVARASVCGVEVILRFHRQQCDVPSGALNGISDGEVDLHATGDRRHSASPPGDRGSVTGIAAALGCHYRALGWSAAMAPKE